jgi:hypothetical protein
MMMMIAGMIGEGPSLSLFISDDFGQPDQTG